MSKKSRRRARIAALSGSKQYFQRMLRKLFVCSWKTVGVEPQPWPGVRHLDALGLETALIRKQAWDTPIPLPKTSICIKETS